MARPSPCCGCRPGTTRPTPAATQIIRICTTTNDPVYAQCAEHNDASLARLRGGEQAAAAMTMVKDWQMIELEQLGGKGPG